MINFIFSCTIQSDCKYGCPLTVAINTILHQFFCSKYIFNIYNSEVVKGMMLAFEKSLYNADDNCVKSFYDLFYHVSIHIGC
jgi:hypothetical protein